MVSIFKGEACLYCHTPMSPNFGWENLLLLEKKKYLCDSCQSQLEKIEGEICKVCSRPLSQLEPKYIKGDMCNDCFRWEEDTNYRGVLLKNYSLYLYNDFLKELIVKYKYRGDYVLSKIFTEEIKKITKIINPNLIVPIPLSPERLQERGFNQAEGLIKEANLKPTNLLTRVHTEKQSKKSRTERIHIPQVFRTTHPVTGEILLIDDIYTTGSTLRHAAQALKEAGAQSVVSLTIARG